MQSYFKNTLAWLTVIQVLVFMIAFGDNLLHPGSFMYTVDYDGLKNYFNYTYYTQVQEGMTLKYFGMGYPYSDHILYADATTALAVAVKFFGLGQFGIEIYNLFFLISFALSPFLTFAIARELNFYKGVDVLFALFVVWMHPMMLRWGEWSNLSLSIVYLLAIYVFIRCVKSPFRIGNLIGIVSLIFISSFLHLYYLVILGLFLGISLISAMLFDDWKKLIRYIGAVALAGVFVMATVYLSDHMLSQRPVEGMGFDNPDFSCRYSDYFNRYSYLTLPSVFDRPWNEITPKYLGAYFPAFMILLAVYFIYNYAALRKTSIEKLRDPLVIGLLLGTTVCFFASLGFKIQLPGGHSIYNFLNPMNYLAEISDSFRHFRYLSRFGDMAFTGISLMAFSFLSILIRKHGYKSIWGGIVVFLLLMVAVDVYDTVRYSETRFTHSNKFSREILNRDMPDLSAYEFDAILPVPYYHVGSETRGYIIDDNNSWSRETYMMAIKYGKPLMSQKTSRASVANAKKLFSLFTDTPDSELLSRLSGKSILLAVDSKHSRPSGYQEPAETLVHNQDIYVEKWDKTFLLESGGVKYYLVRF